MATFEKGIDLLLPGQTGLFISTDGSNFTINDDGTGESGWWKINPSREITKVVIVRKSKSGADIYIADRVGYEGSYVERVNIFLDHIDCIGSTQRNWQDFVNLSRSGSNPIRYLTHTLIPNNTEPDDTDETGSLYGAGFGTPEENRKVEQAAIQFVMNWYQEDGWEVLSVEQKKCGYDLHCTKADEEEHVEVKGIRGNAPQFMMTASEVNLSHSDPAFRLCLVLNALTNPSLSYLTGREFTQQAQLTPLTFRIVLP